MASRKRRSSIAARRNLLIGLSVISVLLVVTLLSIPRFPGGAPEEHRAAASGETANRKPQSPGEESGREPDTPAERPNTPAERPNTVPERRDGSRDEAPAGERDERVAMTRPEDVRGRLAVVIDDVGNNRTELEPFLSFPGKLTIAVLPGLDYSRESARKASNAGKEVIVHMPMAAENGRYPGPGTLTPGDEPNQLISLIANNLSSVPGAVGVNNHMGSLATADSEMMGIVLGYLKARGLFFLDSRTTAETVVPTLAPDLGVPWLERDVFLDNEATEEYVNAALQEGLRVARSKGHAVLIGHVGNEVVAQVLKERFQEIRNRGYRFVSLQDLLASSVAQGR